MSTCIEFKEVNKSYSKRKILHGLNLAIAADLTTAIVGESGSGKSTLIQMANGLVIPEQGQVSVFGTRLTANNSQKQRLTIGYSQQGAGLFPHMSIYDNVCLMARLLRWPEQKIRGRYRHLMELLGLDAELDQRYPYSLSGGQQQRVSLCRAMMLNPPLLLLDEPFSALDPVTRDAIHQEFLLLQKAESCSIVLVTHDMGEALKLAQQIVVLFEGAVIQHGSVETIQQHPANDYVATLFAAGTGS